MEAFRALPKPLLSSAAAGCHPVPMCTPAARVSHCVLWLSCVLVCVCVCHAGLPFAICSIFLAEPVGVPRQLLPYGLKQLLDIASNDGLQEPWPRVRLLAGHCCMPQHKPCASSSTS